MAITRPLRSNQSTEATMMDTPPSLSSMFIQSVDTLRGREIPLEISPLWNERPPLLVGPRGTPETTTLLKGLLRKTGVPPPLRCAVWLSNVMQIVHPHSDWEDYRTLNKARALDYAYEQLTVPPVEEVSFLVPDTSEAGKEAVHRVLACVRHVTGLDQAPLLPTLVQLLLTHMSESYTFCCLRELTHSASWYLPTHPREHEALRRTFRDVLYKLHPQTAEYLEDRGVLDNLDPILKDFFIGLLPLPMVLRILDIYTLEGYKVLFRFGVALLVLYKRHAAEECIVISNADDFWHTLQHWGPYVKFEFLQRKAYGLHGRMVRQQMRFPSRNILQRILQLELEDLKDFSEDEVLPEPLGLVEVNEVMDYEEVKPVLLQNVDHRQALASWVPLALRLTNLQLLYSTNFHGRSLERLYNKLQCTKHSILVAEVLGSPYVVGLYASQAWRPSPHVYGDGGCFLFRLAPDTECYKWTPRATEDDQGTALLEQFMVARENYLSLGGNPDGSSGLRLNEDLTRGESSTAVGFDNPPLHGGSDSVFSVGLVEVYGLVRQIDGRSV